MSFINKISISGVVELGLVIETHEKANYAGEMKKHAKKSTNVCT